MANYKILVQVPVANIYMQFIPAMDKLHGYLLHLLQICIDFTKIYVIFLIFS